MLLIKVESPGVCGLCTARRTEEPTQHNTKVVAMQHSDVSADRSNILDLFPEIMGSI